MIRSCLTSDSRRRPLLLLLELLPEVGGRPTVDSLQRLFGGARQAVRS